jgi:F0F1-type ATP synthase membrane subunit b/b'
MAIGAGGLFDFNATFSLMAIHFIFLTVALTCIFYKPLGKIIDAREVFCKDLAYCATKELAKANSLELEYEDILKGARSASKVRIKSVTDMVEAQALEKVRNAQQDANARVEQQRILMQAYQRKVIESFELQINRLSFEFIKKIFANEEITEVFLCLLLQRLFNVKKINIGVAFLPTYLR